VYIFATAATQAYTRV